MADDAQRDCPMNSAVAQTCATPVDAQTVPGSVRLDSHPTAEKVADLIAGLPTIDRACAALRAAGWRSGVAGNRITVNDSVFVRYIDQDPGPVGGSDAKWVVYGTGERPAVRIVVARDGS